MENFLKKIGPWIPLLIAAGYFAFLISTWAQMSNQMSKLMAEARDKVQAPPDVIPEPPGP